MTLDLANQPVTVHYFELGAKGRGEIIRLFLEEAGIEYSDIRVPVDFEAFQKYAATSNPYSGLKKQLIEQGKTVSGSLPVVEVGNQSFHAIHPTLRYFSKTLGKYNGRNLEEEYLVDQVADQAIDSITSWVTMVLGTDEVYKTRYLEKLLPANLAIFERFLKKHTGPFVLGDEFSYADCSLYQILYNNGLTKEDKLGSYPLLKVFVKAFEARPRISAFLASKRRHADPF